MPLRRGQSRFAFRPLAIEIGAATLDVAFGLAVELQAGAMARGHLPRFALRAQGRGDETALIGALPGFALSAETAGRMAGRLPGFALAASVPESGYAVLEGRLPGFALDGRGLSGSLASVVAALPWNWALEARTGARVEGALPAFALDGAVLSGSAGVLQGWLPGFGCEAQASSEGLARLVGALPGFGLLYGELAGQSPGWVLQASASAPVAARTAWVTNLRLGETTRYTNYDFLGLYRLGDALYGAKADGLYRIGGDSDDGAPIGCRFVTAPDDYGTDRRKHVRYLYLGCDDPFEVAATADGLSAGPFASDSNGTRARLARGLKGRYWSFEISNWGGRRLKVDGFEPSVDVLRRRLG